MTSINFVNTFLFFIIYMYINVESFFYNNRIHNLKPSTIFKIKKLSVSPPPSLMPDPMPNSIGNFFENKTDDMSFIQVQNIFSIYKIIL